jgi:TrmH family RNA methyltransferase
VFRKLEGRRERIFFAMSGLGNLRVVLVGTRNPLNMGAVARAMSNFGALELRVVAPYEKAFREARSAVGAEKLLADAKEFASVAEAVADCSLVVGTSSVGHREIQQPLKSLAEAGPGIRARLGKSKVAILFGSEKWGLSNESLSYCHWLVRIPTREEHRSMNLGQAVAVCLYELVRGSADSLQPTADRADSLQPTADRKRKAKSESGKLKVGKRDEFASMETVERITETLLGVLHGSGYVAPRGSVLAEEKLRRMIRRFALNAADAEVFLGMVKKVEWKIDQKE